MLEYKDKDVEDISKITGVEYSEEQYKVLSHDGGMCIDACAGSGKTTVLTHLLAKRVKSGYIQEPSKVLCTTYSKAGEQELNDRIQTLFNKVGILSTITARTLHSTYVLVLKHFGISTEIIESKDRLAFIREACRDASVQLGDEDLQLLESLLSYQVNNLMSDEALLKSYVYTLRNVSLGQYTAVRNGYNRRKQQTGVIDFDDLQLYMYTLLVKHNRQDMIAYCKSLWTDFYIDEAQDISKIQFEILRKIADDPRRIVFVGDEDQCIYQWRGADPSILLNICGYYDIERFRLSTNYRCRGNIVRPASVGIVNNVKRTDKTMVPYAEGGQVRICDTTGGNLYNQAKYAFAHIKKLVKEDKVSPDDIAVLSRNNQHIAILNSMLFREGIYCDTAIDMRFTKSNMYKDIRNVIELASDSYNSYLTETTFWRVCVYLGNRGAKVLASFQSSSGLRLSDTLGYILKRHTSKSVKWDGNVNIPATADARIATFVHSLQDGTINYMLLAYKLLKQPDLQKRISGLLDMYLASTEFMYKTKDRIRSIEGMVHYTTDLIKTMGVNSVREFFRASEQFDSGKMVVPGPKVCMSTLHGAKGKEWKHLVMFAVDNVTFPSFEDIVNMRNNKVSMSDIKASIDEQRRLHYVGLTRAKEDLTIFTDSNNTSVFTLESFGVMTPKKNNSNEHIVNMATLDCLYDGLVAKAKDMLFSKESPYYYSIDISNIGGGSTFEYKGNTNNNNVGMSLDSIQTGAMGRISDED